MASSRFRRNDFGDTGRLDGSGTATSRWVLAGSIDCGGNRVETTERVLKGFGHRDSYRIPLDQAALLNEVVDGLGSIRLDDGHRLMLRAQYQGAEGYLDTSCSANAGISPAEPRTLSRTLELAVGH